MVERPLVFADPGRGTVNFKSLRAQAISLLTCRSNQKAYIGTMRINRRYNNSTGVYSRPNASATAW